MKPKFYWRLPRGAVSPIHDLGWDPDFLLAFCNGLERWGIDGSHISLGPDRPDPLMLALALARATKKLRFVIEHRPASCSPTLFVQQVNTFALLSGGRIAVHFRDDIDERHRLEEYLTICHRFWDGDQHVDFEGRYFHIEGGRINTPFSVESGHKPLVLGPVGFAADVHILDPATPSQLAAETRALRGEAALELTLTIDESPGASDQPDFTTDPETGISLKGSPRAVAVGIGELCHVGIAHFILKGLPGPNTMSRFGSGVLPLLRPAEDPGEGNHGS